MRLFFILATFLFLCPQANAQETRTDVSSSAVKTLLPPEPVAMSGMVLMPTAYRGWHENSLGVGLDLNGAYYIGRLYGKNTLAWTTRKKNYLDRIGVWLLTADGKMAIQTEEGWRPAVAVGVMGTFLFRDSPQPAADNPSVTVKVQKKTEKLGSAYAVLSKKIHPKFITSVGYMEGTAVNFLPQLSEFLAPYALELNGHINQTATSRGALFGGFIWMAWPDNPIKAEIIIPQGAPAKPKLINLHLSSLLKFNFELSFVTFEGGWDILGMIQFRYPLFPKPRTHPETLLYK
ncbi:MAG: hypothetical protein NTW04_04455 [Elusimicrobia bacterium]|nr:hypothetical protein [Elusimicrobiota bacterium]